MTREKADIAYICRTTHTYKVGRKRIPDVFCDRSLTPYGYYLLRASRLPSAVCVYASAAPWGRMCYCAELTRAVRTTRRQNNRTEKRTHRQKRNERPNNQTNARGRTRKEYRVAPSEITRLERCRWNGTYTAVGPREG